ncbi:MAG: dipeptidase, partial [Clostridiales bacterium]|nr:dipeptidase [Clostridiales bacterium]
MNFLDLHCDTASKAFNEGKSLMSNDLAVDITRAENVGADCFFAVWSVYEEHESPFEYAVKVIKFIKSCRPNSLISIEGGDVLEGRIENVKKLKAMGVKILTVAWNGVNQVCSGAISGTGEGLTSFGFSAVRELENNEIVVDCSHLNERGFYDLLKTARKPFCATHSNAFAVTPHPRNLTDAQIREIAKIGGIIGLCPYSLFVGGNSIENFLAHAEHVLKVSKTDKILAIG